MLEAVDQPRGLNVFIAEDNDDVRGSLAKQLEFMGHTIVGQATNRIDMLNTTKKLGHKLGDEKIDVYVTDVSLPPEEFGGLDAGREAYRRWRTPSILFSGIQDQSLLDQWALEEHALAYILKGSGPANLRFALALARRERTKRIEHGIIFNAMAYIAQKTDCSMHEAYERIYLYASRSGIRPIEAAESIVEMFQKMEK